VSIQPGPAAPTWLAGSVKLIGSGPLSGPWGLGQSFTVSLTVSNTAPAGSAAMILLTPTSTALGAWAGAALVGTWDGSSLRSLTVAAQAITATTGAVAPLYLSPGASATYGLVFRVTQTAAVAGSDTVAITIRGAYWDSAYGTGPSFTVASPVTININVAEAVLVSNHIVENEMFLSKNTFYPPVQVLIVNFTVKQSGNATVKIYNVAGELVKTLFDGPVAAGSGKQAVLYSGTIDPNLRWDGTANDGHPVSSGTYLVFLDAPGYHTIKKVNVMR
ncbi:MAG TPA: hypothetical protein VNZ67_05965, partial [bacterium]|nr:hypothetical protein [bacterium]